MKAITSSLVYRRMSIVIDKHSRRRQINSCQTQAGVVLVISLIILLLLTIIGLFAMQTTALEEKMAGNLRDKNLAFQTAEVELRAAKNTLDPPNPPLIFTPAGTGGLYLDDIPNSPNPIPTATAILTDTFWSSEPHSIPTVTGLGNRIDDNPPVYIIQKLPEFQPPSASNAVVTGTNIIVIKCKPYKITVRATGGTTNTVVVLQSVVVVPPCP